MQPSQLWSPHKKWNSKSSPGRISTLLGQLTKTELLPITIAAASFLLVLVFYLAMPNQPKFNNQALAEKVKAERVNQKPSHQLNASLTKDTLTEALAKAEEEALEKEVEQVLEDSVIKDQSTTVTPPTIEIPNVKNAIIITGAYRNIEGVKRKIEQIISLGFNPYQDRQADINRVGVQFSYQSEADIQRIMSKVQQEISPRAWLLEE